MIGVFVLIVIYNDGTERLKGSQAVHENGSEVLPRQAFLFFFAG